MPSNTKSNAARIPCGKCGGYVGEKLLLLPGEILQTAGRAEPQNLYQLKMYRDGLVLQGCQPTHGTLLVQNYSSDLKLMLDQMNRLPPVEALTALHACIPAPERALWTLRPAQGMGFG